MFSACAVLGTTAYYLFAWVLFGRDPKRGTIIPLYEPPQDLSPALMRYIWKEEFDDRTFWASALSMVAKGAATMEEDAGQAILRPKANFHHLPELSVEEEILLNGVTGSGKHKVISVNMLEGRTASIVQKMADSLHRAAIGRWFRENRYFLFVGIALCAVTVVAIARPSNRDEWMAIVFGISVMTPAVFYLWLLLLRIKDMCRAAQGKIDIAIIKRGMILVAFVTPCLAAILLGSVVLSTTFGWLTIAMVMLFTLLTLFFSKAMKIRTAEGRALMDKIEGFRLFLRSVERFPLDRDQGPGHDPGLYEKYLPYAVALEVEQKWGDKFVALASMSHKNESQIGACSLYLGMWNGKPVEIMYKPEVPKSGRI